MLLSYLMEAKLMTKKYFTVYFSATAAVALATRFFLQLSEIDPYTGFYYSNPVSASWAQGFLVLLLMGCLLAVLLVWRAKLPAAQPARLQTKLLGVSQIALGLFAEIGAYFTAFSVAMAIFSGYRISLPDALTSGLTILAGLVLIIMGLSTLAGKQTGLVSAVIVIAWMSLTLITTFMQYPIVYNVSDNMLHVLVLAAGTAFFVYYFKVLLGVGSRRDTAAAAALGLITAFFAAVLAIPRWYSLSTLGIHAFTPSVTNDDLWMVAILGLMGLLSAAALLWGTPPPAQADEAQED